MASTTTNLDQSKKNTKAPSIPVRQTKTSKIRSERGNKVEFFKNEIQKLKEWEAASTSRSDITNSKDSLKIDTFKKPLNISRKSVVSKSSDVISRTNSGLKSTKNPIKSPPRTIKSNPIKSTQSESKLKPQKQCNKNKINDQKNVKITLIKTTQFESKQCSKNKINDHKNVKITLNKTTQPTSKPDTTIPKINIIKHTLKPTQSESIQCSKNKINDQKNVKITLNKTTQPTSKPDTTIPKINTIKHTLKPTLKTRETMIKNEKKTVQIQSPLRKSISAMHLKRVSIRDPTAAIFRSFSAVNVSQTIDENETLQIPNFNTPMGKRRSVYNSTPMTIRKNKNLSPWSGCWSPTAQDLKRRLSVWMEKNGKPYNSFNNLRCFGLHYLPAQEENKENVRVEMAEKNSSYEDLKIKLNDTDKPEDVAIAYEALNDLRKLIAEGYSVEQCEAWLDVIRTRFEEIEDKQEYWECMAAIDEARGQTETFYNKDVNESYIDNLLQQFNVMNLTPSSCKQRRNTFNHSEIFKSTAINFAVKECSKNEDTQYLVTPIKRSTRHSTAGKLTPGIIVCSTLDELDSSVRSSMRFRTNKALKK